MLDSASVLTPETPSLRLTACLVAFAPLVFALGPCSSQCRLCVRLSSLPWLCGCDLEPEDQQGFRLGWVISVEVDWCSQGMLSIFRFSATIGLIVLALALVLRRISGWVTRADAPDEHHSCDGEPSQLEQQAGANSLGNSELAGDVLPTDAHESWDYEDYAEWLANLDDREYRHIFNISEPGSDEPDFTSVWGNEHVPDEDENGNAHDAARGSDEPPATSASDSSRDDEPLVYLTKYGR